MRWRGLEEQGGTREGTSRGWVADGFHNECNIHRQSFIPNYALNNYCMFGLVKDAVGFSDEKDSAFAFQKLTEFMGVMRQISILDCVHTV